MTDEPTREPESPRGRRRKDPKATQEVGRPARKRGPRKPRVEVPESLELGGEEVEPDRVEFPVSRGRRLVRLAWKYGSRGFLLFLVVSSLWILLYRFVNPPVTPLMLLRHFRDEEDVRKRWRSLEEISPDLVLAAVAAEDQRFFRHGGFDWDQIQAAIDERLRGGRLRGGSTISQQTAKNVFLWPGRSWIRKGLETWFTKGIELGWGKERILEVYLNVAEMGRGVYGAEAAAQYYFQKTARDLTRRECAMLVTVLPDPLDRSPLNPTEAMRERQAWVLRQMDNLGSVSALKSVGG